MTENEQPVGAICLNWWAKAINTDTGKARRTRAELRRAHTPIAVLGVSVVHDLNQVLIENNYDLRVFGRGGPDKLALLAFALAHVKENLETSAAYQFGAGDPKPLSEIRFNALIRSHASRDLMRPIARALAIIGNKANVYQLSSDLYWWNDKTRTNWCFDYYGAANAKPINEEDVNE